MLAICGPGRELGDRHLPRMLGAPTRAYRYCCQIGAGQIGARHLPGRGGDASNLLTGLEPGARHLPKTRRDASYLRPGLEVGARHLPKTRRDASNLRPGTESTRSV
jgi:hypothetical protein